MRTFLLFLLVWGVAGGAFAQTHPCDASWPTAQTITPDAPYRLTLCAPTSTTEATLYLNGTPLPKQALKVVQGANAAGLVLFDGTLELRFTQGSHTLQLGVWAAGVEVARSGFLSVQAGTLSQPTPPPSGVTCTVSQNPRQAYRKSTDWELTSRCQTLPTGTIKGSVVVVSKP